MGLAALPHVLWRRRIAVAVGALLAIAATVALIHRGAGAAPTASSLTLVLIDTPKSLVVDAKARGADTIYTRAQLVAGLIADDDAKAEIARRARLRPSELAIAGPGSAAPPSVITPLAEQATTVAKPTQPYLVSVEVAPSLPIISIDANAPRRDEAVKLGRAAVDTLPSVARVAPGGGNRVVINQLGQPLIQTHVPGHGRAKAVIGGMMFFILWCLGCVVFDGMIRRRKSARAEWLDTPGILGG
jgi:hypothetical protein